MHMAIAAGTTSPLHAAPAVVGRIAQDAGAKRLLLSHIGPFDLDAAIADVKKGYTGPLTVGADLQCTDAVTDDPSPTKADARVPLGRLRTSLPATLRTRKRPRLRGAKSVLGRKHPTEDAFCVAQKAPPVVAEMSHARRNAGQRAGENQAIRCRKGTPRRGCFWRSSPRRAGKKKKAPLARGQVVSWEKTSNRGRRQSNSYRIAFGCRKVTRPRKAAG